MTDQSEVKVVEEGKSKPDGDQTLEPGCCEHPNGAASSNEITSNPVQKDLGPLFQQLVQVQQDVQKLSNEFKSKLKYDESKQKIIDQLHGELQEYRNDLIRSLLRPVFMDIIHLADDQRKLLSTYQDKAQEDLDPGKLLSLMEDIPDTLDEILYRQGVDIFQNEEPQFDPNCQKALKRITTHEADKKRKIAQRVRPGYQWDGHLLRPEIVGVYVYQPEPEEITEITEESHHE